MEPTTDASSQYPTPVSEVVAPLERRKLQTTGVVDRVLPASFSQDGN